MDNEATVLEQRVAAAKAYLEARHTEFDSHNEDRTFTAEQWAFFLGMTIETVETIIWPEG